MYDEMNIDNWYEKKANYVRTTMKMCSMNTSLNDNQHRALAVLATYRHKIHKASELFYDDESMKRDRMLNFLTKSMPVMLHQASLPPLDVSRELEMLITKTQTDRYVSNSLSEDYFENVAHMIAEQINLKIEDYLGRIDYVYGTSYAPSRVNRYVYYANMEIA